MVSLSDEQQTIVDAIKGDYNVVVDAVAGSGKTTTVLGIAQACPDKQFCVLMYNSRLKSETRVRMKARGITNMVVHTFHSLCVNMYDVKGYTDEVITSVVENRAALKVRYAFDVLVIDEMQDITTPYYRLVLKMLATAERGNGVRIVLLGDKYQEIYGFKFSDSRFLTHADPVRPAVVSASISPSTQSTQSTVYPVHGEWRRHHLSTSYRLTPPMADFVNTHMVKYNRMRSSRDSVSHKNTFARVQYRMMNLFATSGPDKLANELISLITTRGYSPADIAVLAYSPRKSQMMQRLNAAIVKNAPHLMICVPVSDEMELTDDIVAEKLLMCSMHQMKGLERKIIVVLGFDDSHYFCDRDAPRHRCPNILYVAATRAKEVLYLVHDATSNSLPFTNMDAIRSDINVNYVEYHKWSPPKTPKIPKKDVSRTITDLLRYMPEQAVSDAIACLTLNDITHELANYAHSDGPIRLPRTISNGPLADDLMEEFVADLNGVAIPALYEMHVSKDCELMRQIVKMEPITTSAGKSVYSDIHRKFSRPGTPLTVSDFLCAAAVYHASNSGYISRLNQLPNFNWLDGVDTTPAFSLLKELLDKPDFTATRYELPVEYVVEDVGAVYTIEGRIDAVSRTVDGDYVCWEFKCTGSLTREHTLQCAMYMLGEAEKKAKRQAKFDYDGTLAAQSTQQGFVVNLVSGEVQEITASIDELRDMARTLLRAKCIERARSSDEEFFATCVGHVTTAMTVNKHTVKSHATKSSCPLQW